MSEPDFDRMTKDEIIAWFQTTDSLAPVITTMTASPPPAPAPEAPMMLLSIRLPVALVEQLDHLAGQSGSRRSEVIRDALTHHVADRTAPVPRNEAEHALDVLRRLVTTHTSKGRPDPA